MKSRALPEGRESDRRMDISGCKGIYKRSKRMILEDIWIYQEIYAIKEK